MELKVVKDSKRYDHCVAIYAAMVEAAEPDEHGNLIYTGFLTHLFNEKGFTSQQYSQIMQNLKRMGCVENWRRGSREFPSVWILHHEPTRVAFDNMPELPKRIGHQAGAKIEQRIKMLEERLERVENELDPFLQQWQEGARNAE